MNRTPLLVLAGGKGSRLAPLTCHRAKPAVPFAGRYRIIDFVLSNVINSGYSRVYVLTQFMASSLIRHISRNWHLTGIQEFIEIVPAQMRMGPSWYKGTADAVFQNLNLIHESRAPHVGIFSGDHIYKFAIDQMQDLHESSGADLTIAAWPVPVAEAHHFGIMEVDDTGRLVGFQEKPKHDARTMPGDSTRVLASMGNYFLRRDAMIDVLTADAHDPDSVHDFGKNVIPRLLRSGARVQVYDFGANHVPGERVGMTPYWRDVGTIEGYFAANMEVRSSLPAVNLYNREWRIRTAQRDYPPARFVRHSPDQPSTSSDSLVCEGAIVSSSTLERTMLGYDSFVHPGCHVEDSLVLSGCDIGEHARLRRVLLDKNCTIEPGTEIGVDANADRERFPFVSESGIVVLPKGTVVPRSGPVRFAFDMAELMRRDPDTKDIMAEFEGRYDVTDRSRHSHQSSGPRYKA